MSQFRNILVVQIPGGGSAETLHRAADLARRHGARIKLLSAIGEVPPLPSIDLPETPPVDLEVLLLKEHREQLEEIADPLRGEGLEVDTAVRVGPAFAAIISEVIRHDHDLVLKTAEGPHGIRQKLFGTTALHLIRKCPCPVWIVKPTGVEKGGRVLAAVDPSPDDDALPPDDAHFLVNDRVLQLAATVASLHGADLVVGHAWSVYGEGLLRGRGRMKPGEVDRMLESTRQLHERQVLDLIARNDLGDIQPELRLLKGDAGDVLPVLAEEEGIDLIVMGSIGRTGLSGFLIGNTAETVLNRVDCSVLTVKPAGFVTPVRLDAAAMMTSL